MKKYLYIAYCILLFNPIYSQCEGLVVSMSDSWGDGWNGNILTIGSESFTLSSGSIGEDCYTGGMDVPVTCGGGMYPSEVFWSILDADGNELLAAGAPFDGYLEDSSEPPECEYSILTLNMIDTWGDGWNGNVFCINSDCTSLYIGSSGTDQFCVDVTLENTVTCGGGSYQDEVLWTLSDSNGTTLLMGGAPFEGCVGGSCESEISELYEFNDNGQLREYYFYQPDSIQNNAPLIFVLHGYGGAASGMISYSAMNSVASEHGFAVCYPQGISDQSGYNFWNVGYAFHQNQTVDDVAFLSSLAHYLQDEYGFDSHNTFVTGFSNGGDMSYMLACQANDVFKAIAPVAGSMMETIYNTCDSSPIPVLEIHGRNDNVTLWDGDMENNDGWGAYNSTPEGIDFWIETNGCLNNEDIYLPNTSTSDGSYIINHRYFDCNANAEVWLYEVVGGGHDWPGSSGNMDIESSEDIWSFFSQYAFDMGDINSDGEVNVLDVIMVVNMILEQLPTQESADLNNDSDINILDVLLLVNIILN